MVSFSRHRYNSVTACSERRSANLVFTEPSLGAFFKLNGTEGLGACRAERTKVADPYSVEVSDQTRGKPVAEQGVPGKRSVRARTRETRTDGDVGAPLGNRSEEKRKLSRPITVVTIQEYDNIGRGRACDSRQAGPAVSTTSFGNNSGTHACSNLRRPVCRVVVDDDDLGGEIGGKITYDAADGLCLVARRNDD